MICQDCKKWGSCKKAEKVCEDFEKMHRTITKLDKAENGIFEFGKLEVEDEKNNN